MNVFINHTNHPSASWGDAQRQAAEAYGEIQDIPFPAIPADWSEEDVAELARASGEKILAQRPAAVLCQGEFTYVFALTSLLMAHDIPVLAATSEREVVECRREDGQTEKVSRFVFSRFRRYELLK